MPSSLEFHCVNVCITLFPDSHRCLFTSGNISKGPKGKILKRKKRILICLGMSLLLEVKPQLVSNGISVTHFLLVDFIKVEKP